MAPRKNNRRCDEYSFFLLDYILCALVKRTQRENAYRYIRNKVAAGEFFAGERLYPAEVVREIGSESDPRP
jgi:hypothetical protein